MIIKRSLLVAGLVFGLAACGAPDEAPLPGRWYTASQVADGKVLFQAHCASCHKADASGTTDWKRRLPDGSLPPPPLNGTAHAWHHDIGTLQRTIEQGGVPLGGTMPAFGTLLDAGQRLAVIAYFQSHWPEEIYERWRGMYPPD